MTPPERRGKRLFLVLSILIILEKFAGVARAVWRAGRDPLAQFGCPACRVPADCGYRD